MLLSLLIQLLLVLPLTGDRASSFPDAMARNYVEAHRSEWKSVWDRYDVPADIAEAVVFPEVVRYSFLKDKVEKVAVEALYIKGGTADADYSIGRFQMKPSFAETLEKIWNKSPYRSAYNLSFDTSDSEKSRSERIARLENDHWQCIYLAVFLKMIYLDYGSFDKYGNRVREGLDALSRRDQVKLCATAYNRGVRWCSPGTGDLDLLRRRLCPYSEDAFSYWRSLYAR